jgi:hypothetical protein
MDAQVTGEGESRIRMRRRGHPRPHLSQNERGYRVPRRTPAGPKLARSGCIEETSADSGRIWVVSGKCLPPRWRSGPWPERSGLVTLEMRAIHRGEPGWTIGPPGATLCLRLTNQPGLVRARLALSTQTRGAQRARGPSRYLPGGPARVPARCSQADAARAALPPYAAWAARPSLQNPHPIAAKTPGTRPAWP